MAMSYEDFLDIAKDAAKTRHPEAEVTIQKVEKLQGESYVGLSVRPEGKNAAVTMNLHELHDQVVENPKRLAAVMSEFLSGLDKALEQIPQVDVKQFTEYENVKGNLMMQVIPVEPNKEKLEQLPHKTIEDIAVVYRIDVSDSRHHNASVLVTNQMLEKFGITPEQLHMDAVISQMETHPPTLKNMSEMMAEMSGGMMDMPESPMWVATVEGGLNGAAVVQIPEFMDQAAEKLGGCLLPSMNACLSRMTVSSSVPSWRKWSRASTRPRSVLQTSSPTASITTTVKPGSLRRQRPSSPEWRRQPSLMRRLLRKLQRKL